jgi:hypothetical protein
MDFRHNPATKFRDADAQPEGGAREEVAALREGIDYHDHRFSS